MPPVEKTGIDWGLPLLKKSETLSPETAWNVWHANASGTKGIESTAPGISVWSPKKRRQVYRRNLFLIQLKNYLQKLQIVRPIFTVAKIGALFLIRVYQAVLSPFLGPSCRFSPSCSEYAYQAITRYGPLKGSILSVKRICRCHPFHPGGFDPVPWTRSANSFVPHWGVIEKIGMHIRFRTIKGNM